MADIVKFPQSNCTYVGEGCNDLPVFKGEQDNGDKILISCWKLSPEELEEVQRTGRVWLRIWGHVQPPVYVGGSHPFVVQPVDN